MHCHEMVTDSRDRLLCSTMGEHFNALAYSKDGKLQDSRQLNMTDPRSIAYDSSNFMNPHDVYPDEDENLYVPQRYSRQTYPIRLKRI